MTDGRSKQQLLGIIFGVLGGVLLIAAVFGCWWHQRAISRVQAGRSPENSPPQLQLVQLSAVAWEGAPGEGGSECEAGSREGWPSKVLSPPVPPEANAGSPAVAELDRIHLYIVPSPAAPAGGQLPQGRAQHSLLPASPSAKLSVAREQAAAFHRMRQLAIKLDLPGGADEAEAFAHKHNYTAADIDAILGAP